jgi:hypothetical protein
MVIRLVNFRPKMGKNDAINGHASFVSFLPRRVISFLSICQLGLKEGPVQELLTKNEKPRTLQPQLLGMLTKHRSNSKFSKFRASCLASASKKGMFPVSHALESFLTHLISPFRPLKPSLSPKPPLFASKRCVISAFAAPL